MNKESVNLEIKIQKYMDEPFCFLKEMYNISSDKKTVSFPGRIEILKEDFLRRKLKEVLEDFNSAIEENESLEVKKISRKDLKRIKWSWDMIEDVFFRKYLKSKNPKYFFLGNDVYYSLSLIVKTAYHLFTNNKLSFVALSTSKSNISELEDAKFLMKYDERIISLDAEIVIDSGILCLFLCKNFDLFVYVEKKSKVFGILCSDLMEHLDKKEVIKFRDMSPQSLKIIPNLDSLSDIVVVEKNIFTVEELLQEKERRSRKIKVSQQKKIVKKVEPLPVLVPVPQVKKVLFPCVLKDGDIKEEEVYVTVFCSLKCCLKMHVKCYNKSKENLLSCITPDCGGETIKVILHKSEDHVLFEKKVQKKKVKKTRIIEDVVGEIFYLKDIGLLRTENGKTLSFEIQGSFEIGQKVKYYPSSDGKSCIIFN